jgi:hypothetical protein
MQSGGRLEEVRGIVGMREQAFPLIRGKQRVIHLLN